MDSITLCNLRYRLLFNRLYSIILSLLFSTFFSVYANAASSAQTEHVKVSLHSLTNKITAGKTHEFAVQIVAEEGWHTYWQNPGDTGLPTRIEWSLPNGAEVGDIEWPVPERIDYAGMINYGYHGEVWLMVPIIMPVDLFPAQEIEISAKVKWLVCREVCIPEQAELVLNMLVDETDNITGSNTSKVNVFERAWSKVPKLNYDVAAKYTFIDSGELHIEVENQVQGSQMPVFTKAPEVFVTVKGLVDHIVKPNITVKDNQWGVVFKTSDEFETPPEYITFVSNTSPPVEIQAKYDAKWQPLSFFDSSTNIEKTEITQTKTLNEVAEPSENVSQTQQNILLVLLFSFLGGLILNLMPCVFPVLSLKIVSLVESGNHNESVRKKHGLAYTFGVVLSFLSVALLLILLRSAGEQIGWGFQLQSPWFVGLMAYLIFALGLSMSGVFEIGTSLQDVGSGLSHEGYKGSFFTGVLATVVATPCTAPFMGGAIGFALSQSIPIALLVFAVMGLGLALPFLLIAYVPVLANMLPKPGAWMIRLKEVLAFPLYLTAIWLVWVFGRQLGHDAMALLLVGLLIVALAAWLWRIRFASSHRTLLSIIVLLFVISALLMLKQASALKSKNIENSALINASEINSVIKGSDGSLPYTKSNLDQALDQGKTVFINMTADWCITCKVNEKVVLKKQKIQDILHSKEVVYLKGDWTNSDANITAYLEKFNRNGVPLYVVYRDGQPPKVLPQVLTEKLFLKEIIE